MEEILASIRRIIAEDEPAKPDAAAPVDEVLELTEEVRTDGSVVNIADDGQSGAEQDSAEDLPVAETAEPVAVPEPETEPSPETEEHAAQRAAERLVSAATAAASVAALAQISALSNRDGHRDTSMPLGDGQLTIEAIVRDLLRPMLREWLDANLPDLVKRLVKDEIVRMTREAQL